MKIALIGASGNIGRSIALEAIQRGHEVTALVRSAGRLPPGLEQLPEVEVDIFNSTSLAQVVKGHDVLASAYGPGSGDVVAVTKLAARLVAAVRMAGIHRLMVVGGAGSLEVQPGRQLVDLPTFPAAVRPTALAHREAFNVLKAATDLSWTFFAPAARIGPGPSIGSFRVGPRSLISDAEGVSAISYADYAIAFVNEIENPRFVREIATAAY